MNEANKQELIEFLESKDFTIIGLVKKAMEQAEKLKNTNNDYLSGDQKYRYVMMIIGNVMCEKWGDEIYEKYENVIPELIEFLIMVSNNEVVIHINDKLKGCKCNCF